jgi:hypothetical protein
MLHKFKFYFSFLKIGIYPHLPTLSDSFDSFTSLGCQCQIFNFICILLFFRFEDEIHSLSHFNSPRYFPNARLLPVPILPNQNREFAYYHGSNVGRDLASILLNFSSVVPLKTTPLLFFFFFLYLKTYQSICRVTISSPYSLWNKGEFLTVCNPDSL